MMRINANSWQSAVSDVRQGIAHHRVCWPRLRNSVLRCQRLRRGIVLKVALLAPLAALLLMSFALSAAMEFAPAATDAHCGPSIVGGDARRLIYDDDQRLQGDIPANALPQSGK